LQQEAKLVLLLRPFSLTWGEYSQDNLHARHIMIFLKNVQFIKSVFATKDCPLDKKPQFCFIGRSNVGKSSLINALTNNKNMAKTSKTAGCTRALNFFEIDKKGYMVDLPGYGYAKINKTEKYKWQDLILDYIQHSRHLKRVFLLIDARLWLKPIDEEAMALMDELGISYQIILTKTDKIKKSEFESIKEVFEINKNRYSALYPILLFSSASTKDGISAIVGTINNDILGV
jgi:GTP-binding protein